MTRARILAARSKALLTRGGSALLRRRLRRFPRVAADRVLAVACTGHGASLAYVDAGGVVRASQLERWTGGKHMMMFSADELAALRNPDNEIDRSIKFIFEYAFGRFPDSRVFEDAMLPWCDWMLSDLGVTPRDIDLLVTSDSHFATGPVRLGPHLRRYFPRARPVTSIEHHEIHQRQAFWASGLPEAAVLTLDTCGENLPRLGGRKLAGTIAVMNQDGECKVLREFFFPETSAGTMYDATTHHVGFRLGDAGKTMGLAPFGEPHLFETLRPHLRLHDDGGFTFMSNHEYTAALAAYTPAREPGGEMTRRHHDVAYAGQAVIDAIVANAWRAALELTGLRTLVYAGGVALNSVANCHAFRSVRPDRLYIPPNPGDPGHALGCALFGAYEVAGWTPPDRELTDNLGPHYSAGEVERALSGVDAAVVRPEPGEVAPLLARCIANGHIVARWDGAAEFGPRALGNRSILCDPRRAGMKDYLNHRVKHREGFRPFAPTVLEEHAGRWFELDGRSPYMLRVVPVRPERIAEVPAVTHVDGSARVQTLAERENPGYHRLVRAFHDLTGVPLVLNTSFNLAGKPIVETPRDAVTCFSDTEIDILALGPYVVSKRPIADYVRTESGA